MMSRLQVLWMLLMLGAASGHNSSASLKQILANIRQITSTHDDNHTLSLTLPCAYEGDVLIQESTAALLAAKALAKTIAHQQTEDVLDGPDALVWDMLDAVLFPTQEEEAGLLLPKYWYFVQDDSNPQPEYYLEGTRFPHWSLFETLDDNTTTFFKSSQRLSALPLQASILWDMLLAVIPPQTSQNELEQPAPYSYNYDQHKDWWDRIDAFFHRLFQNHEYIHTVVMQGCQSTTSSNSVPCYNVLHPWESLMDPTSPVWGTALQPIMEKIEKEQWELPFEVAPIVKDSYDFPSLQVYKATMYLFLEGWNKVNLTEACPDNNPQTCPEEALFNATQFALLDVGYASILAQADSDLAQLAWVLRQILPDKLVHKRLEEQMEELEQWQQDNARLLQQGLWHPTRKSYLSQYYDSATNQMKWLDAAVSNDLIPFWNTAAIFLEEPEQTSDSKNAKTSLKKKKTTDNDKDKTMKELAEQHLQDLSLQLLRRDGEYAFDCGPFPLWSQGGCNSTSNTTIIQPLVNYLLGNGLFRSDDYQTFGNYIAEQSLELFTNNEFGEAYRATPPYDNLATLDKCGSTETLTAAIVYNFDVPDPAHTNRLPLPPLRQSWVITLITFELFMAFSIGVACLGLSFHLVQKLRVYTPLPDEDYYDLSYDSYTEEGGYDSTADREPNGEETATSVPN